MPDSVDKRVRAFLLTALVGVVEGIDSQDVLRRAWGVASASGVEVSLPEFKDALARCGYVPRQRPCHGEGEATWILPLPGPVSASARLSRPIMLIRDVESGVR